MLRKLRLFVPVALLALGACRNQGSPVTTATDTVSFPNVQIFLDGQLKKMDSLQASLMLYDTRNKSADSSLIGVPEARQLLAPFLSNDPATTGQYTRSVFPDSAHHRTIVSFEAEGDSTPLSRVDVFLDSGSDDIRQLYLQYVVQAPDSSVRRQLIWKTDQDFTLITTVDKSQYTADFRKQKVVWKRP